LTPEELKALDRFLDLTRAPKAELREMLEEAEERYGEG
jgi:hypothetical protein